MNMDFDSMFVKLRRGPRTIDEQTNRTDATPSSLHPDKFVDKIDNTQRHTQTHTDTHRHTQSHTQATIDSHPRTLPVCTETQAMPGT